MTVINLRQARKDRARVEKRAKGDENAAKFGRSKAETAQSRAEAELSARRLDGHHLDGGRAPGEGADD
ncbi:DUF4169 family protein [Paracoccus aminophilus]|nr:DUF4169 family protein [Paracoccus aminophilus]